jgi:uncharacterized damage-inducible protein DinB
MSLSHHFLTMAYNNGWANHRLLKACTGLTVEEFVAPRSNFFPTIKATLNHLLLVDRYYVELLERDHRGEADPPDPRVAFADEEPYASVAELASGLAQAGQRLIDYCAAQTDAGLALPLFAASGRGAAYGNRTRLLGHLFQHQIHHRGQVHAMLAGTGVAPPQLDEFFRVDDAPARARDLAELGWSEAAIWGPRPGG